MPIGAPIAVANTTATEIVFDNDAELSREMIDV